jgi:hypothetical protein
MDDARPQEHRQTTELCPLTLELLRIALDLSVETITLVGGEPGRTGRIDPPRRIRRDPSAALIVK